VAALRLWGEEPAVVLLLYNACESHCFFCASPGTTDVPASAVTPWKAIQVHLDERPDDVETLCIGGNEPLLHPELERALSHASASGFESIELMTSGLRLDPERLRQWRRLGLDAVAVPIYAADAATHDAICGAACFDRLVTGLDAVRDAGMEVRLHTIALRRTIDALPALAAFCRDRWGCTLAVAPLREKGDQFDYDAESVPFAELSRRLRALAPDAPLALLGLPPCVDRRRAQGGGGIMRVYFRTQRRDWAPSCASCRDRPHCLGIVLAELERGAASAVEPA